MRIWSRQSQPGNQHVSVTSRPGRLTDEDFDDLARAAGAATSRRGALKILLLGVTGAAAGRGVLAASASGQRGSYASAITRRPTRTVPDLTLAAQTATVTTCNAVIAAKCCTPRQLAACVESSGKAFIAASAKCAPVCQNKKSAACQACAQTVASNTVTSFNACIGQCGTVPTSAISSPGVVDRVRADAPVAGHSSGQLLPTSLVTLDSAVALSASGASCDASAANTCLRKALANMGLCLTAATLECLTENPECLIELGKCYVNYTIDVLPCDSCSGGTHCTSANVCCGSGTLGCPCGSGTSTGCCVDSSTDPSNCGSCGTVCASCCSYQCCAAPQVCCPDAEGNPSCTNLNSSEFHCGSCGNACPGGQNCCNAACVDLLTDPKNCGSCGNDCPPGESCTDGGCTCGGQTCAAGETCCNGACVNTQTDASNCGSCGNGCLPEGNACCSGTCVNTQTDPNNCGGCGNACPAGAACDAGACSFCGTTGPCEVGKEFCCTAGGASTCCVNGQYCVYCQGAAWCVDPVTSGCGSNCKCCDNAVLYNPATEKCCPGTNYHACTLNGYCCPDLCSSNPCS